MGEPNLRQKLAHKMLIYATVKALIKFASYQPLFSQEVWLTPAIVACSGIAAALCAIVFAFRF
jgi:hypothetical protein